MRIFLVLFLSLVSTALAQPNLAGHWTGNFAGSNRGLELVLVQSGTKVTGVASLNPIFLNAPATGYVSGTVNPDGVLQLQMARPALTFNINANATAGAAEVDVYPLGGRNAGPVNLRRLSPDATPPTRLPQALRLQLDTNRVAERPFFVHVTLPNTSAGQATGDFRVSPGVILQDLGTEGRAVLVNPLFDPTTRVLLLASADGAVVPVQFATELQTSRFVTLGRFFILRLDNASYTSKSGTASITSP